MQSKESQQWLGKFQNAKKEASIKDNLAADP